VHLYFYGGANRPPVWPAAALPPIVAIDVIATIRWFITMVGPDVVAEAIDICAGVVKFVGPEISNFCERALGSRFGRGAGRGYDMLQLWFEFSRFRGGAAMSDVAAVRAILAGLGGAGPALATDAALLAAVAAVVGLAPIPLGAEYFTEIRNHATFHAWASHCGVDKMARITRAVVAWDVWPELGLAHPGGWVPFAEPDTRGPNHIRSELSLPADGLFGRRTVVLDSGVGRIQAFMQSSDVALHTVRGGTRSYGGLTLLGLLRLIYLSAAFWRGAVDAVLFNLRLSPEALATANGSINDLWALPFATAWDLHRNLGVGTDTNAGGTLSVNVVRNFVLNLVRDTYGVNVYSKMELASTALFSATDRPATLILAAFHPGVVQLMYGSTACRVGGIFSPQLANLAKKLSSNLVPLRGSKTEGSMCIEERIAILDLFWWYRGREASYDKSIGFVDAEDGMLRTQVWHDDWHGAMWSENFPSLMVPAAAAWWFADACGATLVSTPLQTNPVVLWGHAPGLEWWVGTSFGPQIVTYAALPPTGLIPLTWVDADPALPNHDYGSSSAIHVYAHKHGKTMVDYNAFGAVTVFDTDDDSAVARMFFTMDSKFWLKSFCAVRTFVDSRLLSFTALDLASALAGGHDYVNAASIKLAARHTLVNTNYVPLISNPLSTSTPLSSSVPGEAPSVVTGSLN
jgi:hypothetical protein